MKIFGDNLAVERQRLLVTLGSKERVYYTSPKNPQHKTKVYVNAEDWIDSNARTFRTGANSDGWLSANQTNVK